MKIMIILLMFLNFIYSASVSADTIEARIDPSEPVLNETFQLIINVKTSSANEPYISFDPGRASVLGRNENGVSVRASFINGRVTTVREYQYTYELLAENHGSFYINDIKADIGGNIVKGEKILVHVLRQAKKPKNYYVEAEISKDSAFIGEAIDVKYYLYSRYNVVGEETREYPKLRRFIKRFYDVRNIRAERVQQNGVIYVRKLVYWATVFPEKEGDAYIDPIRLRIQYATTAASPFGNFGFQMQQYKTADISSSQVKIAVKAIPSTNVPKNFTGLVGKHNFKLSAAKNKYITNEAIEVKLTVEGPGALENMESPRIYTHKALEEFDTKSEIVEISKQASRKVFDYTYLAREPFKIEERSIGLSYFDPNTESFKEETVLIPALVVSGSGASSVNNIPSKENDLSQESSQKEPLTQRVSERKLIAPVFYGEEEGLWSFWPRYLNYILSGLVLISLLMLLYKRYRGRESKDDIREICKEMRRKGLNYKGLHKLIISLPSARTDVTSLSEIVKKSNLKQGSKQYFLKAIDNIEQVTFKGSANKKNVIAYEAEAFNDLIGKIKERNENSKELS